MKEIINKTTIYCFVLSIFSVILGLGVAQLAEKVLKYWFNFSEAPVPAFTCNICEHPYILPIFAFLFFLLALIAIKKGKTREIAFHVMMVGILCDLFYLFLVIIAFALPVIEPVTKQF